MTLLELKQFLETLSSEQLEQPAVVFVDDDETGHEIDHSHITTEDIYWEHHGDCLGTIDEAKESLGDEWEDEKDDLVIIKAGAISLHTL